MKNKPNHSLSRPWSKAIAIALLAIVPVAGFAQETTSAIRGKVIDESGAIVAGATVEVVDERTGVSRSLTTNNTGSFYAAKLPVGGPYRVTVAGNKSVVVDFIGLGDTYNLTINMQEAAAVEEIVVIGQTAQLVDVAAGPAATFSSYDMETAVAFDRDIKEVYSHDPRLSLDTDGFQMNCGGQHPRFNSVTLDGVSQNDRFGLNTNGYSTATGMPFPYDGIEQVVVELAPFDVTYSGFSACNINAVSKGGTNEWEFGGFYEFTSDDYRGEEIAGVGTFTSLPFEEEKFGFNAGGALIQDKLFVYAAYEEAEFPRFLAHGFAGSGNGVERPWLSQADYDRITDISNNTYNYDPGGLPGDGTQTEEKYMVRLDWNISDKHNAAVIYNYFDGPQTRASDSDPNEFEFPNHYYVKGAEMETMTLKLNSQWTDAFSTELYYSNAQMTDSQVTVGPKDFADMQITIEDATGRNTVYLGADDSRQANALNYESDFLKLIGQYLVGDHVITFGYEQEELNVFNQFVQHARGGEYDYFDDSFGTDPGCFGPGVTAQDRLDDTPGLGCAPSGIDRFELGRPSRIYYGSGGGTNIAADAAAKFGNTLHSFYIQDEIFFDDIDLTVVAGFRYEQFASDDAPVFNQTFTSANGVPNNANIDGLSLIMPRLGFTWGMRDDLQVRGGLGLYAGGNPNVWLSNAWSNDGLTNAQFRFNYFDSATVLPGMADSLPLSGGSRPGYDVPQEMFDAVAAVSPADANDSGIVLIDPNYEQPAQWKIALGATWDMPVWDVTADFDILHTRAVDTAYYVDLSQAIVGQTSAGYPIYDYAAGLGEDNYMLTNSGVDGESTMLSVILNKSFDWGLDLSFGYAHTRAKDVSPMTSFVAGSNFDNLALIDINNPFAGVSNYVVPHRFTLRAGYANQFFGDNTTFITAYAVAQEGQPISYTMAAGLEGEGFNSRHLLYVPSGPNDPNVTYDPGFDQAGFDAFVASAGLSPGIQARNSVHAKWSSRIDLSIMQEIPLFADDLKGRLFLKVYNLGNLLNDDWGKQYDAQFGAQDVVGASVGPGGEFVYEDFNTTNINDLQEFRSLWEVKVGLQVNFR
ncbi:MAG: carboxypeptidase regulatory-like domain-containing protein [Woeseiaceae bacterium]